MGTTIQYAGDHHSTRLALGTEHAARALDSGWNHTGLEQELIARQKNVICRTRLY
jgi:hypothetical protein